MTQNMESVCSRRICILCL